MTPLVDPSPHSPHLLLFALIGLLEDIRLHHLGFRYLWVPKVKDLVQELVYDDKVGLESVLVERPKVRLEERDNLWGYESGNLTEGSKVACTKSCYLT